MNTTSTADHLTAVCWREMSEGNVAAACIWFRLRNADDREAEADRILAELADMLRTVSASVRTVAEALGLPVTDHGA